jgi:ABC-type Na+ efflux pump permease subunit
MLTLTKAMYSSDALALAVLLNLGFDQILQTETIEAFKSKILAGFKSGTDVAVKQANLARYIYRKLLNIDSFSASYKMAFGIGMIFYGGNVLPISAKYFNFAPSLFIYFVVFFVLGYLIYAIMYSAIGAISNSDQEAQQMSMPVILMLIVPIMMLGYLVKARDSTLSVTLSLIPFFSPIIMFARINLSNPPLIEVLGSIGILIVTILFLVWFVAKIYRVGILMYGKRPTLPEIVKWMRYK